MKRLFLYGIAAALFVLLACSPSATPASPPESPPAQQPGASATEGGPEGVPVEVSPTPGGVAELAMAGEEEVVFDWTTDRCEDLGLPDLPSRAFRDASGQVQLNISHFVGYRMIGPDLNSVTMDCSPISQSAHQADPSLFSDNEWIGSLYTEDGQTVYALVHNEYQGHTHPGYCPQNDYFPCWYNSITMMISTDSGSTFSHIADAPQHHVASLPFPYEAGEGPTGLRGPSNIIKGQDGYYYSYLNAASIRSQSQWVCLMRTDNLSDPKAWRFWDGDGFEGTFVNPYLDPLEDAAAHECPPLEWDNIGASLNDSVTYNTFLNRYVLIGNSADQIEGREVWGWYYAFSDDLIHWTRRKLLAEVPLPWTVDNAGGAMSYMYPSLLDPDSASRNFETTDQTAYLYYTRLNFGQGSLDRDLVRVPVEFTLRQPE